MGEAKRRRDAGMRRAVLSAGERFQEVAHLAILRTAAELEAFTVCDVWERLPEGERPAEARAIGPALTKAMLAGLIFDTRQFRPARNPAHHGCPRRIWSAREPVHAGMAR